MRHGLQGEEEYVDEDEYDEEEEEYEEDRPNYPQEAHDQVIYLLILELGVQEFHKQI